MWYEPTPDLLPLADLVERGGIDAGAIFSRDEHYRYSLHRRRTLTMFERIAIPDCHAGRIALFVLLNPSEATEVKPDPTLTLCTIYTEMLGCETTLIGNLYGYRSKSPSALWKIGDPVGPHNDVVLRAMLRRAYLSGGQVICGWGGNAKPERVQAFAAIVDEMRPQMPDLKLRCLLKLEDGTPAHPLVRMRIGLRDGKPLEFWP